MNDLQLLEGKRGADSQVFLDTKKSQVLKYYFIPETWVSSYVQFQNEVSDILCSGYKSTLWRPLMLSEDGDAIKEMSLEVIKPESTLVRGSVGGRVENMRKENEERVNHLYLVHGISFQPLQDGERIISEVPYVGGKHLCSLEEDVSKWRGSKQQIIPDLMEYITAILENECSIILKTESRGFGGNNNSLHPVNVKYYIEGEKIHLIVTDLAEKIGVLLKNNKLL